MDFVKDFLPLSEGAARQASSSKSLCDSTSSPSDHVSNWRGDVVQPSWRSLFVSDPSSSLK